MPDSLPIRRNTFLLAAAMACLLGMGQLSAAVATITFVVVTGVESLLGLGPALILGTGALAALPAGRAMDRVGRVPVLAGGFAVGAVGAGVIALGARWTSGLVVVVGFVLLGVANGTLFLTRTAAGDMYPPERRARGISLVLFGSVFGAVLGPAVFTPLFSGKDLDADALVVPWLVAAGLMLLGLVVVLNVRPDPKRIAEILGVAGQAVPKAAAPAAPLGVILRRPGVLPALAAALASFAVMVALMNLSGYIVIGHGHHQDDLFPIVSAHILGMFGLVLFVGALIDALGRMRAIVGGLVVVAASALSLVWIESVAWTAVALFTLGLGWIFSFVGATADLVDLTAPVERGKLLGFNDLLSGLMGATLALVGGFAFTELGLASLAIGATVIALAPAVMLASRRPPAPAAEATSA